MPKPKDSPAGGAGPSTNRNNEAVPDPTPNVLDLVAAAIARQDDLRLQETAHVRELMALRADFAKEIRKAETARIDAIRAVDVGAVNRAAEVAATQATTLASQVAVSAETLRTQVAAAASAAAIALAAALEPVQKDIADLRRAQYEALGNRTAIVDTSANSRGSMMTGIAVASVLVAVLAIVAAVVIALSIGTPP